MAPIKEKWMPSPHFSSSRGPYDVAALHTTEGAQTIESLGSWFQNPSAGCSSHHGADNKQRGVFGAYVYESNKAWTQGNANGRCLSIELCTPSGAASNWSRSTWLGAQETLTRNAAEWVAYICGKYKIPIVALTNSQAQGSGRGVCQHVNFGSMGSGHHDCGPGFPMDKVIEWAKSGSSGGGSTPAPTPVEDFMSAACYVGNVAHLVCVGAQNNVIYYKEGLDSGWGPVDPGSYAKSGVDIAAKADGSLIVTYTNKSGNVCTYDRPVGQKKWFWANRGGQAKLCRSWS